MNDQEKDSPLLPPKFGHLEEPLREAQKKVRDIEQQIGAVPRDKGPQLNYSPPGYGRPSQLGNRERRIYELNQEKEKVKGDFSTRMYKELAGVDAKTAKNIRDTVDIHLGNSPYKAMTNKELADENGKTKDISKSQDFIRKIASNYRAIPEKTAPAEKEKAAPKPPDKQENKPMSMPGRVTVNYTNELNRAEGKGTGTPEKSPEKSKGIDKDQE